MKYRILCIAALLCLLLTGTALANSWGAPGDTASIFMDTPDYKEAECLAEDYQRGELTVHMVIGERYYNRLIVAERETKRQPWRVVASPMTAVYQPDSGRKADITREADGFTLRYGSDTYRFREERYGSEKLYLYLSEAHVGGMAFDMEKYMVSQGGESNKWLANISLGDFCIDLMPRSLEEIRRMNRAFILLGGTYTQVLRRGAEVRRAAERARSLRQRAGCRELPRRQGQGRRQPEGSPGAVPPGAHSGLGHHPVQGQQPHQPRRVH